MNHDGQLKPKTGVLSADSWYQFNDDQVLPLSSFYNLHSGDAAKPIVIEDEDMPYVHFRAPEGTDTQLA